MAEFYQRQPSFWRANVPIVVLLLMLALAISGGVALLSNEQRKTDALINSLQQEQVQSLGMVEKKREVFSEHDVIDLSGVIPLMPIDGWELFFPTRDSSELNGLSRKLVSNLLGQPPIIARNYDPNTHQTLETWAYIVNEHKKDAIFVYFLNGEAFAAERAQYNGRLRIGSG